MHAILAALPCPDDLASRIHRVLESAKLGRLPLYLLDCHDAYEVTGWVHEDTTRHDTDVDQSQISGVYITSGVYILI
jgi:hypothetical protein